MHFYNDGTASSSKVGRFAREKNNFIGVMEKMRGVKVNRIDNSERRQTSYHVAAKTRMLRDEYRGGDGASEMIFFSSLTRRRRRTFS